MKKTESEKKRDETVDALKAIGIISVIIGHTAEVLPLTRLKLGAFVYLYHIMVFFFAAGYVFDENSADKPYVYIGKRVFRIFLLYVGYNTLFVLLHNFFRSVSIIRADAYSINDILIFLAAGTVFQTNETMLGAFWFLPVYLVSSAVFCILFHACRLLSSFGSDRRVFTAAVTVSILLCCSLGLYYNTRGMYLSYHIQTSFLAVPVMFAGWLTKKCRRLEPLYCRWGYILSGLVLYFLIAFSDYRVELTANHLGNPVLFFPVTLLGIYFCMCLSKTLQKHRCLQRLSTFIGKNSFHYMALHLLFIKTMDVLLTCLMGGSRETASVFPHSYNLGLTYTAVSVACITVIIKGFFRAADILRKMVIDSGHSVDR